MKKKLFIPWILAICLIAPIMMFEPAAYAQPSAGASTGTADIPSPPSTSAKSLVLIDSKTGSVLYGVNQDQKAYPASITKILTAAIALEQGNLSDVVVIDEAASTGIPRGSSAIVMDKGERFTLEQLLYGLMLISGNDAAVAIAEHISGSVDKFVALMNQKAAEWGAKNSHFANPHGFHQDDHYTTAYDMAMIARHAMTILKFREIVSTTLYLNIPKTPKGEQRRWDNINYFVQPNSKYYYKGATGIKTGYTSQAGHTLVASAQRDGVELIAVLMGEPSKQNAWKDAASLLDYGFGAFTRRTIAKKNTALGTVKVVNGSSANEVLAVTEQDIEITVPKGKADISVQPVIHLPVSITAPVKQGQWLGTVEYMMGDQKVASAKLVAAQSVDIKKAESVTTPSSNDTDGITNSTWLQVILVLIIIATLWILYTLKKSHNATYRF